MPRQTDFYTAREIRWAKRLQAMRVLPDYNPGFVKKVLKAVDKKMIHPIVQASFRSRPIDGWKHDQKSYKGAHELILKAKTHFRPLVIRLRGRSDANRTETTAVGTVMRESLLDQLIKELIAKLDEADRILDQVKERFAFFHKKYKKTEKVISAGEARLIWALKYEVEHEISRRNRLDLRLNPMRRRDGEHRPSYRNQWQLVADLYRTFYWDSWEFSIKQLKETNGKLKHPALRAKISELEGQKRQDKSKPFGSETIRRFAYRYPRKARSHTKP